MNVNQFRSVMQVRIDAEDMFGTVTASLEAAAAEAATDLQHALCVEAGTPVEAKSGPEEMVA